MDNNSNMLQLCRLCLVKDDVNIPIFEEQGDIRQIFLKISSCLPVKVSRDDQLPKKICDGCSYKLDMLYEFWNTSANAEKQLLTWLGEAGMTSQMTDGTISAVAQQIKPADAFVKQETIDPPDIHMDDDEEEDKDYMKVEEVNNVEEPPPKRARRTAAVKAAIAIDQNSDDDDDSGEPMTKVEDDSEDSDNEDHEPAFVDVPSTSADDQPGPSGVSKDGVEAPHRRPRRRKKATKSSKNAKTKRINGSTRKTKTIKLTKERENKIQNLFDNDEPRVCPICEKSFPNLLDYALHSKIHESNGFYSCHICNKKVLKKKSFEKHVLSHKRFKCELCNRVYKRESTALNHSHSWEKDFDCKICGKQLNSEWGLTTHMANIHMEIVADGPLLKHQCKICLKSYLYESGLRLHYSSQHRELGIDYTVICDVCGKSLSCKSKLKQHLRTHTGDKPFPCPICSRKFITKDLMTSHMRVHTGEKPYVCMYCGKEFAQGAPYRYHLKTHTGEKSCSCPICGKEFISKGNMRIHLKSCYVKKELKAVQNNDIKKEDMMIKMESHIVIDNNVANIY